MWVQEKTAHEKKASKKLQGLQDRLCKLETDNKVGSAKHKYTIPAMRNVFPNMGLRGDLMAVYAR